MKQAVLVTALVVILVSQVGLGYCGSDSEAGKGNAKQYNCPYYYMMMQNGTPAVTAQNIWMLLGVGITALLVSTADYPMYSWR